MAGRRAFEGQTSGGSCATLRATEMITVMIPRAVTDNWYQMTLPSPRPATARSPDFSMLKSVRITKAIHGVGMTLCGEPVMRHKAKAS
jgi:hypothetical protein